MVNGGEKKNHIVYVKWIYVHEKGYYNEKRIRVFLFKSSYREKENCEINSDS